MQTKKGSIIETTVNFSAGIVLSLVSYWFLLPMFGIHIPLSGNLALTAWFAGASIVKTYIIRRIFNRADVQHEMRGVRPHVGSIQSLRRSSRLPQMSGTDYKDFIDGLPVHESEGPVRPSTQEHETTGHEDDKELRQ